MKKNNYPIVYAVMKLADEPTWAGEENVYYIASKAYLVCEKIVYTGDGELNHKFEVVFPYPYNNLKEIKEENKEYPLFNINSGECVNCEPVDVIFSNFEEAQLHAEKLNEELLRKYLSFYPATKQTAARDNFNKYIPFDEAIENAIELITSDMKLTEIEKPKVKVKE